MQGSATTINNQKDNEMKTKAEIIKLYMSDVRNLIPGSPARENRLAMLEDELENNELSGSLHPVIESQASCKWKLKCFSDLYYTECGNECLFVAGGDVKSHKYKYCPYCGKEIKIA